ncbi:MAG TPA: pyridoxamine 5'-phosphate oxidase family protein [Methanothrix sp.]|nr:pyridoxamine 5'-phosphate oxidase family protein [Methanothrix sp.]HPJ83659.1 pyridoxamine 5'-phosphate oxidase family protein [Methanothrix sp.]HPR66343.1 pyridoxamine 5'-phosphate oxidase family protein [Methanothrix sp.]
MELKDKILEVIGGEHVAAVATVSASEPALRFMALEGKDDLSLVGATMRSSRKVQQIKEKPVAAISVWSGESYSDPYVVIMSRAEVYEDLKTKKIFWDPRLEPYFQTPENPEYVVLKFVPNRIEYYSGMGMEVWER